MKSGVIVPTIAETRDQDDDDTVENTSALQQIFVLFDTGRFHIIDITLDSNCEFDCEGDESLESGERTFSNCRCPKIHRHKSRNGRNNVKVTRRGIIACIPVTMQILLYKCAPSAMIAFTLDDTGAIVGN